MLFLTAFILVSGISLIVATGSADVVTYEETDVLEVEPTEESIYTQINAESGEIQIIISEENPNMVASGVNPNSVIKTGPVFTIQNIFEQQSNATVWIGHDSDAVKFYVPGKGVIESEVDGVLLQPGDDVTVALLVDTRKTDEITVDSFTVMANLNPVITPSKTGTESEPENFGGSGFSADDDSDDSGEGTEEPDTDTKAMPEPKDTGTASVIATPETELTPTEDATNDGGTTSTENLTDEQAGFQLSSLLWIPIALAALVATMLLFRRFWG